MMIPSFYPSAQDLPFNRASLAQQFRLAPPDRDPGGAGCWLVFCAGKLVVTGPPEAPRLPEGEIEFGSGLFMGYWQGRPCRLASFGSDMRMPDGLRAERLDVPEPQLPIALLSLGGLGRMLLHWVQTSRFCAACGEVLEDLPGRWGKACIACKAHVFPNIASCAIVLVRRPGEILLVRKPEYPPHRYGLVAGFVEFGECLEETAIREVAEETGVQVTNLRYIGSQSWPFPSQLMCGFVADYAGGEIAIETRELVDARWFPLGELPTLPPKRSIARYLLDTELAKECAPSS